MIDYQIISSGSVGNTVVINDEILIDCGVPFKALKDVYKNIKIVLLTHIHSDHFRKSTIKKLAHERPTVRFACGKWLAGELLSCGVKAANIDVLTFEMRYSYLSCYLEPVSLTHNVENLGYKIFFPDGSRLFYATDTNSLNGIEAKDFDLYMVEANYEDDEIKERINAKEEKGEYAYELDVLNNHLSKAKADDFIYKNAGQNSRYVYLHEHKELKR